MITYDNVISITDIRQNATNCIKELKKTWDKIIFKNNKPTAVLVDFNKYEKLVNSNSSIEELEWSSEIIWTKEHEEFIWLLKAA